MSHCDTLKAYYESVQNGSLDPNLFTEDFAFEGPLMQCHSRDEFMGMMQQMAGAFKIDHIEWIARFTNDNNQACAMYDMTTTKPIEGVTRCAETFTFEGNQIKKIQLVFDARAWEKAMPASA